MIQNISTQEWRAVVGYEGLYAVSGSGRVWDVTKDKEVSQVLSGIPKYYYVNLNSPCGARSKRKLKRVHRLVADAFLPEDKERPFIDHIDRNPHNNAVSNLRRATRAENQANTKRNKCVVENGQRYLVKHWLASLDWSFAYTSCTESLPSEVTAEELIEYLEIKYSPNSPPKPLSRKKHLL